MGKGQEVFLEYRRRNKEKDNSEKLATRRRKTKQKQTQHVLDTTIRKQTQTIISTCYLL
jgi:hypothetical protein